MKFYTQTMDLLLLADWNYKHFWQKSKAKMLDVCVCVWERERERDLFGLEKIWVIFSQILKNRWDELNEYADFPFKNWRGSETRFKLWGPKWTNGTLRTKENIGKFFRCKMSISPKNSRTNPAIQLNHFWQFTYLIRKYKINSWIIS